MKVQNMTGRTGRPVANQFIITDTERNKETEHEWKTETFQSYDSIIAKISYGIDDYNSTRMYVYLDSTYWDYSRTTGKYRNEFLGENKAETQRKIDSGEYILTNLN